jgi:epoxyqueuosine reductase
VTQTMQDQQKWIKGLIKDFIASSPLNTLENQAGNQAWDQVLVGFAKGDDPIWQQYKEYVGAFHWTPWEVFNQHNPGDPARAEDLSVISWVLPQRELVREANRNEDKFPADEWARVRIYGEKCNAALRQHIADSLTQAGYPAIAPQLVSNWTIVRSKRYTFASSWSERHAAHAAGLGTFGLCDGLISPKGKALRVGSVVAKIKLKSTPRPYNDHRAYCSFFVDGSCGDCIDRCPVGAISKEGHDKIKCQKHLQASRKYVEKNYGFEGYGCGLCQVGVPCESQIPVDEARKAYERGELPPPPPPLA